MRRYEQVIELIKLRLLNGTLSPGEKLPSVRQLSEATGFSPVTIHHAYELLEVEGVCEARPRSGFYITQGRTAAPNLKACPPARKVTTLPDALLQSWHVNGMEAFGAFYPSPDLFERAEIDRVLRQVLRGGTDRAPGSQAPQGDLVLRQEIAKRAATRGTIVRPEDIIITSTGMSGFNLCLDCLTAPGDQIIVESPSYFPMLAGLQRRGLAAIELYAHPRSGVDPVQFEHLLRSNRIKAALLTGAHHYPTGFSHSEQAMRKITELARQHNVLILENDLFGELRFDQGTSPTLKQFDPSDTVIQFGNFMTSLSPGYAVGWLLAGTHTHRLMTYQYLNGLSCGDGLVQRAIAEHLASRSQDRHLRKLRTTLAARMRRGLELIAANFPPTCSVSAPQGGFMCWVRGPKNFDAVAASVRAANENFSFLPGPVFSPEGSFGNFIALNFSFPWTAENERRMAAIGDLMRQG